MQIVLFARSRWRVIRAIGGPGYPGFVALRLGRIEARFGRGRFLRWGRPPNPLAYENG